MSESHQPVTSAQELKDRKRYLVQKDLTVTLEGKVAPSWETIFSLVGDRGYAYYAHIINLIQALITLSNLIPKQAVQAQTESYVRGAEVNCVGTTCCVIEDRETLDTCLEALAELNSFLTDARAGKKKYERLVSIDNYPPSILDLDPIPQDFTQDKELLKYAALQSFNAESQNYILYVLSWGEFVRTNGNKHIHRTVVKTGTTKIDKSLTCEDELVTDSVYGLQRPEGQIPLIGFFFQALNLIPILLLEKEVSGREEILESEAGNRTIFFSDRPRYVTRLNALLSQVFQLGAQPIMDILFTNDEAEKIQIREKLVAKLLNDPELKEISNHIFIYIADYIGLSGPDKKGIYDCAFLKEKAQTIQEVADSFRQSRILSESIEFIEDIARAFEESSKIRMSPIQISKSAIDFALDIILNQFENYAAENELDPRTLFETSKPDSKNRAMTPIEIASDHLVGVGNSIVRNGRELTFLGQFPSKISGGLCVFADVKDPAKLVFLSFNSIKATPISKRS